MKGDYKEAAKSAVWLLEEHPEVVAIDAKGFKTFCGNGSPKAKLNPETGNMVIFTADLRAWLDKSFPWWKEEGIDRDKRFFVAGEPTETE